ncbi:MAG: HEPN domain-containing protein [Thermoprotei archaeon]
MGFYEEFARKYLEEAYKDLLRARRSFEENDYPDAVFHAQQCVEKSVKAMIEAKREYVYNHGPRLASIFTRVFVDEWREEYEEIVDILGWFTEYYSRSRYPFLLRGRVITPSEYIDRDTAVEAISKAEKVYSIARKYLVDKRIL